MEGNQNQDKPVVIHSKKRFYINKTAKTVFLIVLASLILGGSYAAWVISTSKQIGTPATQSYLSKMINDANALANNGDPEAAKKALDENIKTAVDADKSELLIAKSAIFYNQGDYDQALSLALEAEKLKSTENSAQFIARIYMTKKDNTNAVIYYKKALGLVDQKDSVSKARVENYNFYINELGGNK